MPFTKSCYSIQKNTFNSLKVVVLYKKMREFIKSYHSRKCVQFSKSVHSQKVLIQFTKLKVAIQENAFNSQNLYEVWRRKI